jgi:hypothetical protein
MSSDRVECRSDHAYIGHPVAFYWQDKRLEVGKIISEKQDPTGYSFRVLNEEYGCFELIYALNTDEWSVYRQGA